MTRHESTWVTCADPRCPGGTCADARHLDNITAAGGYYCPRNHRKD